MIGDTPVALDRLALVVDALLVLVFRRHRRRLRGREAGAARLRQVAERQQLHAVTLQADLAIDLEAALKLPLVVAAERTGERPFVRRRRSAIRGRILRKRRNGERAERDGESENCAREGHGVFS